MEHLRPRPVDDAHGLGRSARALRRRLAAALGLQVHRPDGRSLGTLVEPFLHELTVAARASGVHIVSFSAHGDDPTAEYEHLLGVRANT